MSAQEHIEPIDATQHDETHEVPVEFPREHGREEHDYVHEVLGDETCDERRLGELPKDKVLNERHEQVDRVTRHERRD